MTIDFFYKEILFRFVPNLNRSKTNHNMQLINTLVRNLSVKTIERDNWSELKEFHKVMSQTFHPSERGDLEPIRLRSVEMVDKATALQKGLIPSSFGTPEMKRAIDDLVTGSAMLHQLVIGKADDSRIVQKLNELHDTFHVIQGVCRH